MKIGQVIRLEERPDADSCSGCLFQDDAGYLVAGCPHQLCGTGRFVEVKLDPPIDPMRCRTVVLTS